MDSQRRQTARKLPAMSPWAKYKATEVLGGAAAGVFSAAPTAQSQKEHQTAQEEAEKVEAAAKRFRGAIWEVDRVPPPDFAVVQDELGHAFRAELSVFIRLPNENDAAPSDFPQVVILKDIRVRGPRRQTRVEARKDGCEMKFAAFRTAAQDPSLSGVRQCIEDLEDREWLAEDLTGECADENVERRMPELGLATQAEKFKEHEQSITTLREWIYERKETVTEEYPMVGPGWTSAGHSIAVPRLPGIWYVVERQNENGRHEPWMFFNAFSGKYYRQQVGDKSEGKWVQTGAPHSPVEFPVGVLHGSVCLPAEGCRKDALAVILPELAKTGSVLKRPLPYLDKPASLFVLVDGMRGSDVAAKFCAQRFHTQFLPRLSAHHTELIDHELETIMSEAVEALDAALVESSARYAGCGLGLALLIGQRLTVATIGGPRIALLRPPTENQGSSGRWSVRRLAGSNASSAARVARVEHRRLGLAGSPLDFADTSELFASSPLAEDLASLPTDAERLVRRVARATHPFATLGLKPADLALPAVQQAVDEFEAVAHPRLVGAADRRVATAAHARIKAAASTVEGMLHADAYATQLLCEFSTALDEDMGVPTVKRACTLLGVEAGCGDAAAQAAADRRYRNLLVQSALQHASKEDVSRGFRILTEYVDAASRATTVWAPSQRYVRVTRALGLRDFKTPRRLLGTELITETIHLEEGMQCVALLTDGARNLTDERVAQIVEFHQNRPRAAALRLATAASECQEVPGEAVGSIVAYLDVGSPASAAAIPASASAGSTAAATAPAAAAAAATPAAATGGMPPPAVPSTAARDAKRRKVEQVVGPGGKEPGKPARIRIGHVLLKFVELKDTTDSHARRSAPPGRTQMDAEKEILALIEELEKGDRKTLGTRFAAACREKSDCKSALNTPYCDLGWVDPGQWGKEFDAAAFELGVGCLSDVVITPRGIHVLYRLA